MVYLVQVAVSFRLLQILQFMGIIIPKFVYFQFMKTENNLFLHYTTLLCLMKSFGILIRPVQKSLFS